jgi:hypothetical protein
MRLTLTNKSRGQLWIVGVRSTPTPPLHGSCWSDLRWICLVQLIEALDQGDGVEEALADAVSILEEAGLH